MGYYNISIYIIKIVYNVSFLIVSIGFWDKINYKKL